MCCRTDIGGSCRDAPASHICESIDVGSDLLRAELQSHMIYIRAPSAGTAATAANNRSGAVAELSRIVHEQKRIWPDFIGDNNVRTRIAVQVRSNQRIGGPFQLQSNPRRKSRRPTGCAGRVDK